MLLLCVICIAGIKLYSPCPDLEYKWKYLTLILAYFSAVMANLTSINGLGGEGGWNSILEMTVLPMINDDGLSTIIV